jgi:hypothetical protein
MPPPRAATGKIRAPSFARKDGRCLGATRYRFPRAFTERAAREMLAAGAGNRWLQLALGLQGRRIMKRLMLLGLACSLATPIVAQAPPQTNVPVKSPEQSSPGPCASTTIGQGDIIDPKKHPARDNTLSDKLAASNGVICPPRVDPAIRQPTPPGGSMPVIPPPGSPGGDPHTQPK